MLGTVLLLRGRIGGMPASQPHTTDSHDHRAYEHLMIKPRFSVKSLLVSTTLIAAGLSILNTSYLGFTLPVLPMCGWPLIGAGMLAPLGRPWFGAWLGLGLWVVF